MRLQSLTRTASHDGVRLVGAVERDPTGERQDVYFHGFPPAADFIASTADAFAPALLLPAMRRGEPLRIDPPLSPQLCFSLPRIRDIFNAWWPEFPRIDLQLTPAAMHTGPVRQQAATFFSGGVDSFYSLLKNLSAERSVPVPLTHVIFMRGIETRLDIVVGIEDSEKWAREVADATGVQFIVGESNIRTTVQGRETNLQWEEHYYGSGLAAAALSLAPGFAFVCIPSGWSYNHLVSHGSTPMVDEMYSTEYLRVVHDGAEATRARKVARILEWNRDLVLKYLRVCHYNRGGAFNCCKCPKCVRTAVPLRILGAWDHAQTFPHKEMDHWERLLEGDHLGLTEENLQLARDYGDREMTAMLNRVVRRARRKQSALDYVEHSRLKPLLPSMRRVRSYLRPRRQT